MVRGAVQRRLPVGERMVPVQGRYRSALALRRLIVAALVVALVAAAGSGRAGTARVPTANSGSGGLASATVSATAIAAGHVQSCTLTSVGGVKCWGANHLMPVDVPGLAS